MSQIIKARHLKYNSIHQGLQTKKLYTKMTKNMNWICPMTAILNFTICGKTVSFTAWHTAEMNSAQNFHIETTNEVFFLKNAYRSLSRAIFQYFVLTITPSEMKNVIWFFTSFFKVLETWSSWDLSVCQGSILWPIVHPLTIIMGPVVIAETWYTDKYDRVLYKHGSKQFITVTWHEV